MAGKDAAGQVVADDGKWEWSELLLKEDWRKKVTQDASRSSAGI